MIETPEKKTSQSKCQFQMNLSMPLLTNGSILKTIVFNLRMFIHIEKNLLNYQQSKLRTLNILKS